VFLFYPSYDYYLVNYYDNHIIPEHMFEIKSQN